MDDETVLQIIAFNAEDGDCFLLDFLGRCGRYTILVDGGRSSTPSKLRSYLESTDDAPSVIDLFVVTHIDADHISGAIRLAGDPALKDKVGGVWFNDSRHLPRGGSKPLSTAQGDTFASLVDSNGWVWNGHFDRAAVKVRASGPNRISLTAETTLTLLGPSEAALERLAAAWPADELLKAEDAARSPIGAILMGDAEPPDVDLLVSAKYEADPSVANASSITFVVEHCGVRAFIGADAPAESLIEGIRNEFGPNGLHVDVAVFPHHGSARNMSAELAGMLTSRHWIVSTSGRRHAHPDPEAIARVVAAKPRYRKTFHFNSDHAETRLWNAEPTKIQYDYETTYPGRDEGWISLKIASAD